MLKKWQNFNPTELHFGAGLFPSIKDLVQEFKPEKILLVTGKTSMKKAGFTDKLIDLVKPAEVTLFDEVEPNPLLSTAEKGTELAREIKPDLVIGLGGGSAIDAAKAMAITAKHEGKVADYLFDKKDYSHKGLPFMAVPSTPGTSSEITCWSVLTDGEGVKHGYGMHLMYPEKALTDPELTLTLNKYHTGATGFDILSHSIEAFWNANATPISDHHALKAIELVFRHLGKTANNLNDLKERTAVSLASVFAGLAFSQTVTTSVHAASYIITSNYGPAHGHACGLFLAPFFRFFYDKVPKMQQLLKPMQASDKDEAAQNIEKLLQECGLEHKLSLVGVKKEELGEITDFVAAREKPNPIKLSKGDFRKIVEDAF